MTTEAPARHDIDALIKELETAETEFNVGVEFLNASVAFLVNHKGRLNEHQFTAKLEAASGDPGRARDVIDAQDRLRCSYVSGLLAVHCAFGRLCTGLRGRDKLVRTIMKLVATINNIKDSAVERNRLATRCLTVALRSNTLHQDALERMDKVSRRDLTDGRAATSLRKVFGAICGGTPNIMRPDRREPNNFAMFLVPLTRVDLNEYQRGFRDGIEINDKLVTAAGSAASLVTLAEEPHRRNWDGYFAAKSNLNEPQYSARLQALLTPSDGTDNSAAVTELSFSQQQKRIEFITLRVAVTEMLDRLDRLVPEIRALIEELKAQVAGAASDNDAPTCRLVAINNIVAADAILHSIDILKSRWDAELDGTTETAELAEKSLYDGLTTIVRTDRYSSRRWSCSGPGSYTEPL